MVSVRDLHIIILANKCTNVPATASDETIQALHHLVPDNLILAALDIVDRGRGLCEIPFAFSLVPHIQLVFRYTTPWGRIFFEVFGSKGRYSVSVDLPAPVSTYCDCPAFAYSVLLSDNQAMVKLMMTCLYTS